MQYETMEDQRFPGDWRVEAVDADDEGKCHVTLFFGPDAESRAREYAAWKNSGQRAF